MESILFDQSAPKKALNVSVNTDLLQKARETGVNLSQLLESKLAELLKEDRQKKWREENIEAITDYNDRITTSGVFSDGQRKF